MKKIILFLTGVFLSLIAANAQDIDQLFKKYKGVKDVDYVQICPGLMKGAAKIIAGLAEFSTDLTEEEREGIKLLESIEAIQLVTANNKTVNFQKDLQTSKFLKKNKYQMLLETSNDEQDMQMFSKDKQKDVFSDLLVLVTDKDNKSALLACITGKISPENVSKLIAFAHKQSKKHKKEK